jgi:hypothetical protein
MQYHLNEQQKERLKKGVSAMLSVPFIDDIEDFIWEAIFAYTKNISLIDPLTSIRSKRLFDIVDMENKIGWSAKALQWKINPPCEFELVIQRADIFKKANELGFNSLDKNSSVDDLGKALLKHWYGCKVLADAEFQDVNDKRVCILLKTKDRKKYAYFEEDIKIYNSEELNWRWTDDSKTGLQGIRRSDGFVVFRWYPNQKQLFERFNLKDESFIFTLEPSRLSLDDTINLISNHLNS